MTTDLPDEEQFDDVDREEEARCPDCGATMDPDEMVCPQCGAEFGFFCPECDRELPPDAAVCPHCGTELDEGFEDEAEGGAVPDSADAEPEEGVEGEVEFKLERADYCANCGEPIGEGDEECPSCGMDLCPDCGNPLDPEDEVCARCGAEFAFSCPGCDKDIPSDAEVCPHCGYRFEEDEGVADDG